MSTYWSRITVANRPRSVRPWNFLFMPTKTMTMINNPWRHTEKYFIEENKQLELKVPLDMNKFEIREYLEKIYGIKVAKVNTLIRLGKTRRFQDKNFTRKDKDWKKAYVTLDKEQNL